MTFFFFFLVDEGRKDPNATISGPAIVSPPPKCHLNGGSLACQCWPNIECWLGSFVIFQGIRVSIAKKPYICDFSGGSGPPVPPSGSAHDLSIQVNRLKSFAKVSHNASVFLCHCISDS